MSDLVATNCGCGNESNNCCSSLIWIILILSLCNNGSSSLSNDGCGCGNNDCIWLILLLLFCGGNNGCGSIF